MQLAKGADRQVGDKAVARVLKELNELKILKPSEPKRARSLALLHECKRLAKERMGDHLLVTTVVWVFVSLLRMDSELHAAFVNGGIPGVLAEILKSRCISEATRAYAGELCSALWCVLLDLIYMTDSLPNQL